MIHFPAAGSRSDCNIFLQLYMDCRVNFRKWIFRVLPPGFPFSPWNVHDVPLHWWKMPHSHWHRIAVKSLITRSEMSAATSTYHLLLLCSFTVLRPSTSLLTSPLMPAFEQCYHLKRCLLSGSLKTRGFPLCWENSEYYLLGQPGRSW